MSCPYKTKTLVHNDDNNITLILNYMSKKWYWFFFIKIEHDPDKKRRHEMKAWKIVHIGFVENKHTAPQNAFKNWCYAFTLFLIWKLNFNFIFYYESTEEEEICKSSVLYMPMRNWFQCIIIQKNQTISISKWVHASLQYLCSLVEEQRNYSLSIMSLTFWSGVIKSNKARRAS